MRLIIGLESFIHVHALRNFSPFKFKSTQGNDFINTNC